MYNIVGHVWPCIVYHNLFNKTKVSNNNVEACERQKNVLTQMFENDSSKSYLSSCIKYQMDDFGDFKIFVKVQNDDL